MVGHVLLELLREQLVVASKEVPAPEERGHGNPEQHHGQDLGLQTRAGPEAHKNPKSILSCVGLGRWLRPKRSSHAPLTLSQVSAVRGCLEEPVSPPRPASILRAHQRATIFFDADSASLLPEGYRPR
jgi:hypothetical protein